MNIHVGNLTPETTEDDLRMAFEPFGKVESSIIGFDRTTKISKGYGFIQMDDKDEAQAAILGLAGKQINGKLVTVAEARGKSTAGQNGGIKVAVDPLKPLSGTS